MFITLATQEIENGPQFKITLGKNVIPATQGSVNRRNGVQAVPGINTRPCLKNNQS
jgi:hypothetical protein